METKLNLFFSRAFFTVEKYPDAVLPERKTADSAGYDFAAAEDVLIPPGEVRLVPTGVKAFMCQGEVLLVFIRSSLAAKKNLMLANGVGVIDADYYNNPDNEGHIMVAIYNSGNVPVGLDKGQRIAQGIFTKFLITSDDNAEGKRVGGFGSSGK